MQTFSGLIFHNPATLYSIYLLNLGMAQMCHSQAVDISCFFIDQSVCLLHLGSPDVSAPFLRSEERSQIIVSTDEMLLIRSSSANWNFPNNIKKMAHLKTLKMKNTFMGCSR